MEILLKSDKKRYFLHNSWGITRNACTDVYVVIANRSFFPVQKLVFLDEMVLF